jgi:DNA replication protein DnaC
MSTKVKETNIIRPRIFTDITKCPTCGGSGYIVELKSNEETKATYGDDVLVEYASPCPSCNGGHASKVESAKRTADIPQAYYDSRYSAFDWSVYRNSDGQMLNLSKHKVLIDSFINDFDRWEQKGQGLYIWSRTKGSGKTFLASCICNELMAKNPMRTKFVSATNLLNIAKSADSTSYNEYERDPIKLLCNCKLLVLDDLGQKNTGAEWMNDILFRIFDERYQKKLVTIVTSNIKLNSLDLDDRVVDRIYSMCIDVPIPDYCVRAKEATDRKMDFLRELGIVQGEKGAKQIDSK